MIRIVLDCGVLISAIGWGGNPRACLDVVASGRATLFVTNEIWNEYSSRVPRRLAEEKRAVDPQPVLSWILTVAQFVEAAPLGKQRARDAKDDPYLACALRVRADAIVSNDRDLLALRKPFGIPIMTPIQFLKMARKET
jgi:putative PIN family toxin of toxin-antitoxin system